ncbi:MAG TPA: AraC family transcriptional regulator [Candidatus Sulfotelmatobacter sp.]|nr:AraC family transcriptional regulator [Candidatus Sulfotelmatobacter sp.]
MTELESPGQLRYSTRVSSAASKKQFSETGVWSGVGSGWRPLWAGFRRNGFSVEWHDFECNGPLDVTKSVHPDSVEICLNLDGHAEFSIAQKVQTVSPASAAFYYSGRRLLTARRLPHQRHQFVTVEISRDFLKQRIGESRAGLHPKIQTVLAKRNVSVISETRKLTADQQRLISTLRNPPAPAVGRVIWFESKVLELMSELFFIPAQDEFFCERQKRVTQERVQHVIELLKNNLAEPPDLLELGRRVGCSPFYLSRTFSQKLGMTIPQYLRQLRMERAAELLRSGKFNVTEAALEVGYSSMSHFSQAFCQTMGCCPNLYPLLKNPAAIHR